MLKFKCFLARSGLDVKPFQTECFEWCLTKERLAAAAAAAAVPNAAAAAAVPMEDGAAVLKTPPGGILALEMGLGKTIIMLGLIECNFQRRTLIILPLILLAQWEKCIQRYFGHQPLIYHGSRPRSLQLSLAEIMKKPIVLTTYGQIALPSLKQQKRGRQPSLLSKIRWGRIICDEAHHVSHKETNQYKGVQVLSAKIRWLVTGTPIQNREEELYNLFTLLGFAKSSWYFSEGDHYTNAVQHLIFHKTKAEVGIQIPKLHEHTEIVEWANESERQFSSHIHSLLRFCNVPQQAIASSMEAEEELYSLRMRYLTKSRQVCVYPPMLKTIITQFEKQLKEQRKYTAATAADDPYATLQIKELYVSESKINAVVKTMTERLANGCGKIVFCHYYAEIDAFEKRLRQAGFTKIHKFDGRITSRSVKQAILHDATNEVLLAQIKMCQEGLNLQDNYSEVYFPSPHFNPATEDQAIARCWRIGQQKEVFVFRYIMIDTETSFAVPCEAAAEVAAVTRNVFSMDSYSARLQRMKRMIIAKMESAAT